LRIEGRRILLWLSGLLVLALLAGGGTAFAEPVQRADGSLSEWDGNPTMLSGETRISRGELIYTDWLYDDYGADYDGATNNPVFRGNLAPTQGDYRYPTNANRYGYNAADIREVRFAADQIGLHVVVFLETMKEKDAAAVTLAIDGPRNLQEDGPWPDGAGIDGPPADQYVTFWGTGGWITDARGKRERLRAQAVNLAENAIEVDLPWRSIPYTRERTVNLRVVSGLADPQAKRYLQVPAGQPTATAPGGGSAQGNSTAVFDLAFDRGEVPFPRLSSHWGESFQSEELAQRDATQFGYDVDLRRLEARESDSYAPQAGRFYDRVFRSQQSFDAAGQLCTGCPPSDGIRLKNNPSAPGGDPTAQFLSPYQPYGLWIPSNYQPGTPSEFLLNGHSLDVNHNEYEAVSPNFFQQIAEDVGGDSFDGPHKRFVITPLGRGMDTWYIDTGLKDVLEAWDDLRSHYSIDDERTALGGYSMGGYMTYRMGLLMPDRFAATAAYVPPPAYQLWAPPADPQPSGAFQFIGNTNHIVYNGLDIPFEINDGGADELVPAAGAQEQAQTFREFGNPHRFYFYPTLDHFALILADEWGHSRDWLDDHPRRNASPDEVRFMRFPAADLPQYGLRFDGAYWIDGMQLRGSDACSPGQACQTTSGLVEAYTLTHGHSRSSTQEVNGQYAGPPAPATIQGTDRVFANIPARNFFDLRMTNLAAITVDSAKAGLNPNQRIDAHLTISTGDQGRLTLTLLGSFPAVNVTLDGHPVNDVVRTADRLVIELTLSAQHDLVVAPQ
jgi:pimeloyl-ACP methyl ester carboxylesterase